MGLLNCTHNNTYMIYIPQRIWYTIMLLYHLTRMSKTLDLKAKVSFSNDSRDHPLHPLPIPYPFNVGYISLAVEDITPTNIDLGGPGGTFDQLQRKVVFLYKVHLSAPSFLWNTLYRNSPLSTFQMFSSSHYDNKTIFGALIVFLLARTFSQSRV